MNDRDIPSFLAGFFVGALVGGVAALLLAPQSGAETRAQIRDSAIELKEKAEATYGEALEQLAETTEQIRATTEEMAAKIDEAFAQRKEQLARLTRRTPSEPGASAEATVEEGPAEA